MNYDDLCSQVSELSPHIRYCALHHISGEKLAGGYTDKKFEFLSNNDFNTGLSRLITARHAYKRLEEYCDVERYALFDFKKMKIFVFPIAEDAILIVTMEHQADHQVLLDQILHYCKIK